MRNAEPTVLYVGSIFSRRHVPELIEGFTRLARRHPQARLEIVGDNRTTPRIDLDAIVRASGVAGRIQIRSYVSDEELRGLYRSARAFAFLSDYEGFGLTPVEALSAGMPLVVLDTPIAREIYGPAAIYVQRTGSGPHRSSARARAHRHRGASAAGRCSGRQSSPATRGTSARAARCRSCSPAPAGNLRQCSSLCVVIANAMIVRCRASPSSS